MTILRSTITLLILALIVMGLSFIYLDGYPASRIGDILVEAHGLLFDLVVFGILFVGFSKMQEKKHEDRINCNLIDDYRNWTSEEATHRILGGIRRLSENNYHHIDASGCFLRNANLDGVLLASANFRHAMLRGASFRRAKLRGANLYGADCRGVDFSDSDLDKCILAGADLRGARGLESKQVRKAHSLKNSRLSPDLYARLAKEAPEVFKTDVTIKDSGLPTVSLAHDMNSGSLEISIDESKN